MREKKKIVNHEEREELCGAWKKPTHSSIEKLIDRFTEAQMQAQRKT
jgi:hypothetical protein